jgi:DNA sulfur modification protein DndB
MKQLTIPCVRGVIGDRVFYSTILKASQISQYIKPAHEIREARSLEDWLQRKQHDRCKKIAKYLVTRGDRFFNSIVVGVFGGLPKWVPFDCRKAALDLLLEPEEIQSDSMGLLIFAGTEQMFAIDGQHRVAGIRMAYTEKPDAIASDEYSVVFIAHIDDDRGKVATRRLFSDINKRAVPVSNGDNVVIDEDDICAIVARRLYASYPPFKLGKLIVVTEKEKLPDGDTAHFTNLLTLYSANKKLRKLYSKAPKSQHNDEVNVSAFYGIAISFFDFMIREIPSYRKFFKSKEGNLKKERLNHRNLLFRPVGQVLLAQLYVLFVSAGKLKKLEAGLKKIQFESPGGVFDNLLWIGGKVQNRAINRTAALNLCAYKLGLDVESPEALTDRIIEVTGESEFKLPARVLKP